jgi:hypothetical protein
MPSATTHGPNAMISCGFDPPLFWSGTTFNQLDATKMILALLKVHIFVRGYVTI